MIRPSRFALLFVTASLAAPSVARADPPANVEVQPRSVGWAVLALSMAAGLGLSTAWLAVGCPEGDTECARWVSLGIWGGLGIASGGAVAGLIIVESDVRAARLRLSVGVDRRSSGGATPRATLVWTF